MSYARANRPKGFIFRDMKNGVLDTGLYMHRYYRLFICLLLICIWPHNIHAQTTFSSLFTDEQYLAADSVPFRSASFGDYNNDGFIDLATTQGRWEGGSEQFGKVWKNNPENPGEFSLVFTFSGPLFQVAWADFDNDGDLDLFGIDVVRKYYLIQNNGAGDDYSLTLVGNAENTVIGDEITSAFPVGATWFDANSDNRLDLFQSPQGTANIIHQNFFEENLTDPADWFFDFRQDTIISWEKYIYDFLGTPISGPGDYGNGSYSLTADINNDGKQELIKAVDANSRFGPRIWHNWTTAGSDTLRFNDVSELVLSTDNISLAADRYSGVSIWDADNDGDLDVLFLACNDCNARNVFYESEFGYRETSFSPEVFNDKLVLNETLQF
ncbi:MAG: VCBS repeat-containing protein, partial [Fibrobacteria bacterium]|nr:VCBS repeat-containing protein [Fibrobacteria bacterium]